jgi:hypothetical protein
MPVDGTLSNSLSFVDITPVTFQGKLVVSGTILAGVTIIPVQAGALVESLMDAQKERELAQNEANGLIRQSDTDKISSSLVVEANDATIEEERGLKQSSLDGSAPQPNNNMLPSSAVDAVTPCPSCGATFHWTSARYCWSCGSKLSKTG